MTPIEPIPVSSIMNSVTTDPNMITVCAAYSDVSDYLYLALPPSDAALLLEAVEQWAIDQYEEGWEGVDGTSARLTDEAEDVLVDFLHGCA